ncbi:MAG TPA: hypothetical protein DDW78_00955 [Treponema sp.]|nr:hypothetical protein [Treponema sp.]
MVLEEPIKGRYVSLVSVLPDNAGIILNMRSNKDKAKFLHPVDNILEKQKSWIQAQNCREGDFLFFIRTKAGRFIGTCGVYEIDNNKGHIGRLISYGSALETFEAYYLLINFCFENLNLLQLWGDTDINNKSAYNFTKQFGFSYTSPVKDADLGRMVCICNLDKEMFNNSNIRKLIYRGE